MVAAFVLRGDRDRRGAGGVADRLDRDAAAGAGVVSVAGDRFAVSALSVGGVRPDRRRGGQIYARWGAAHLGAFANWGMLVPGVVLTIVASASAGRRCRRPAWTTSLGAGTVLMRTGVCLVILGVVAHVSRRIGQLPHVFGAVAQESLVVYFVHLCIVYGSIWNTGLSRFYGEALGRAPPPLPSSRSSYQ